MGDLVVRKHRTVIDGTPYETELFDAGAAIDLEEDIRTLFSEDLFELLFSIIVASMGGDEEQAKAREVAHESTHLFATGIRQVLNAARARPGGVSGLLKRLLARTTTTKLVILTPDAPLSGNVGEHFDTHFMGRRPHLDRVAYWVWVTNFLAPYVGDVFASHLAGREAKDSTEGSVQTSSTSTG